MGRNEVNNNQIKFSLGRFGKKGKTKIDTQLSAMRQKDFDEKFKQYFQKFDTNNDGVVSAEEMKAFTNKLAEAAGNSRLSQREAKKFLKQQGMTDVSTDELFNFLKGGVADAAKGITDQTNKDGNVVIRRDNDTIETVMPDGNYTLAKDNKTKFFTQDGLLTKDVVNEQNCTVTTEYSETNKKPQKITKQYNSGITEIYTYDENGKPAELYVKKFAEIHKYKYVEDNTKLPIYYEQDLGSGCKIVSNWTYNGDKITKETSNSRTGQKIIDVTTSQGRTETITEKNGDITKNTFLPNNGKKLKQEKTINGSEYSVEYDGNGNTKGIIVQNGESIEMLAKRFGVTKDAIIEANPGFVKGNTNKYFLVGQEIKIPKELEADDKTLQNRKTSAEAIMDYERLMKIRAEEQAAAEVVQQTGENAETLAKIEQERQELFEKQKDANESEKSIAGDLHKAMQGIELGSITSKRFEDAFKKINENNVVEVLNQYKELSPDETIFEAIFDETGSFLSDRKKVVSDIINKLKERAKNAGINDERINQALDAINEDIKGKSSIGVGYVHTSKLDGLINNLVGQINASEALTNTEKELGVNYSDIVSLMNNNKNSAENNLNAQLDQQGIFGRAWDGLKGDGKNRRNLQVTLCSTGLQGVLISNAMNLINSDNTEEKVKKELQDFNNIITKLNKTETEEEFQKTFKNEFGVDYDANLFKGYNRLQQNYNIATFLTKQKEDFAREFKTTLAENDTSSVANVDKVKNKYGKYLKQTLIANGQLSENDFFDANAAVDKLIDSRIEKDNLTGNKAFVRARALRRIIKDTNENFEKQINGYTGGKSLNNMKNDLQNTAAGVFGNKHDIMFRVNDYVTSQQQGALGLKMGAKISAAIVIGIATGGTGVPALLAAGGMTTAASATVDFSDRLTSKVGLQEGEIEEILKNAVLDGAGVVAGGGIAKYASQIKTIGALQRSGLQLKNVQTISRYTDMGAQYSSMVAGDIATGAADEYLRTGEITIEGTTYAAIFSAAGNLISLKPAANNKDLVLHSNNSKNLINNKLNISTKQTPQQCLNALYEKIYKYKKNSSGNLTFTNEEKNFLKQILGNYELDKNLRLTKDGYRNLARKYHTDKNGGDEEIMKLINLLKYQ